MHATNTTSSGMAPDRESLYLMTKLKLDRFKLRKRKFDEENARIIEQTTDRSLTDKVQILYEGVQRLFSDEGKERYLRNFDTLLAIIEANTSTSNNLLENFCQRLLRIIDGGKRRSEYNYLFGLIMSQWFSGQEDAFMPSETESMTTERLITNEKLETIIFDRPKLDLDLWRTFLESKVFAIFHSDPKTIEAFENFKKQTEKYGRLLLTETVSSNDVRRAIKRLISDGSLDGYRNTLMTKLALDENSMTEFASSLNLLIYDLAEWNWSVEGIRGIFRRNLAGKYRCYYQEDFLTAIFFEHLGLKWSSHFKEQLSDLFEILTKNDKNNCSSRSIQHQRLQMQRDEYWMAALPDEKDETNDNVYGYDNPLKDVGLKEKVFYLVNTEIQLHQTLHPEIPFTVMCADLEWFGPSISHEIVQIFLQQCGVPQIWLDFFDRFLKQPIYYKPNEPIRQRQRGVPISHSLSHLFSELLLFGMDLYVYQNTGIFNYRLHDDFWFFDSQLFKVEQAWTLMNEYATITGLNFNKEKCGSIQILPSNTTNPTDSLLPQNNVKWGLLTLQADGRFTVNQPAIVPFLDEMKKRLTSASSILEWVNLYNKYVAFFMRNFGKCADILGIYHIEQLIKTFQYIHQYIFPENNGNALSVLTNLIMQHFPACLNGEICEAWLYWPLSHGGLDLKNVYLELGSVRQQFLDEKTTTFDMLPARDKELYNELVEDFDSFKKDHKPDRIWDSIPKHLKQYLNDDCETLITFDDYVKRRETGLSHWREVYSSLLKVTPPALPKTTTVLEEHFSSFRAHTKISSSIQMRKRCAEELTAYTQWLLCCYGEQIEATFDQLDFIDSVSLPIGLISVMKKAKIDWDKSTN